MDGRFFRDGLGRAVFCAASTRASKSPTLTFDDGRLPLEEGPERPEIELHRIERLDARRFLAD
jgi:hypothetical protein